MKRFIEEGGTADFDVIVIGGGITGAAVAYEAASRGLSVALVDKGDFGAATSSATSKLIHGGLRYLANFELGLVRESLRERRTLENIAPNLVYPLPFVVPLYQAFAKGKLLLKTGMVMYDLLSWDKGFTWDPSKRLPLHRSLSKERMLVEEPVINEEGLTGALRFYDCASLAPERLTLAFVRSAVKKGAVASNHAKVEDFVREGGRIAGVVVRDRFGGKVSTLRAKVTVNCGGPWADLLLGIAKKEAVSGQMRRSEGIHIITRALAHRSAIGGMTPSGRPCNLVPWRGHTLIGTTDREYVGDPDDWRLTRAKIEDYIAEVNASFGKPDLVRYSDIIFAYGGLRPLVDDQTESVYKSSRKYEIYDHAGDGLPGLVTVEGGKYTTSRNLAENVFKMVVPMLGLPRSKSKTAGDHLAGCEIPDLEAFLASARSANADFAPSTVDWLARLYGTELPQVLGLARADAKLAVGLDAEGEMPAQALYAVREEMARTLTDILLRRTGIGTLGHPGATVLETIAATVAGDLGWDAARVDSELEAADKALTLPS